MATRDPRRQPAVVDPAAATTLAPVGALRRRIIDYAWPFPVSVDSAGAWLNLVDIPIVKTAKTPRQAKLPAKRASGASKGVRRRKALAVEFEDAPF